MVMLLALGLTTPSRARHPRMEEGAARFDILDGRVLAPGSEGEGWWDGRTAANPIVLPPSETQPGWRCFYYGRPADKWNGDAPAFLPTGLAGLAESDDGLSWRRVRGPLAEGSILAPSEDAAAFDHVHIGLTDVLPLGGGSYAGLYLGGSAEKVDLGMGPGPIVGFKMRPGAATSVDGVRWERQPGSPLLDTGAAGEWDANFCSWPRALPLDPAQPDRSWLMTYHALVPPEGGGGPRWAVGAAVCEAGHALGPYRKLDGPVLEGGGPGSWDESGIGTRHVIHCPDRGRGALLMVYEGVGADGRHRLGLATSDDGARWTKCDGFREPGGPIFEGAPKESDAWDNGNVGTPWLVRLPSGRWRLYYVGTSDKGRTVAIGAAEADDVFSSEWQKVTATC